MPIRSPLGVRPSLSLPLKALAHTNPIFKFNRMETPKTISPRAIQRSYPESPVPRKVEPASFIQIRSAKPGIDHIRNA
jgi:hypothetical protein